MIINDSVDKLNYYYFLTAKTRNNDIVVIITKYQKCKKKNTQKEHLQHISAGSHQNAKCSVLVSHNTGECAVLAICMQVLMNF